MAGLYNTESLVGWGWGARRFLRMDDLRLRIDLARDRFCQLLSAQTLCILTVDVDDQQISEDRADLLSVLRIRVLWHWEAVELAL